MTAKIPNDSALAESSRKLLCAAYEFLKEKQKLGINGGVHWVDFENGEAIIFTRGEYKDTLMQNIDPAWPVVRFDAKPDQGEHGP